MSIMKGKKQVVRRKVGKRKVDGLPLARPKPKTWTGKTPGCCSPEGSRALSRTLLGPTLTTAAWSLSVLAPPAKVYGVRLQLSGRIGGAEIAGRETVGFGRRPTHRKTGKFEHAQATAFTPAGTLGIQGKLYRGVRLSGFARCTLRRQHRVGKASDFLLKKLTGDAW